MKNFDWKTFLKRHSVFSRLKDDDIEQILKDNESEERDCLQGSVIIREGEFSDSVFLIGTGSVQVVLQGKDGYEINISTLGKGEFFGEMAPVERIPRSATVIARENTTLLEVSGQKFCDIMRENPIIAFNVLLKLSERLRYVSEHILAVKLRDADEKINLFNIKLDAELKAVDASLKAALVVFDQTKMRTDEVISTAERSSARLKTIASVVGGFAAVVLSIFTWFGIEKFQDITKIETSIIDAEVKITAIEEKVVKKAEKIIGKADQMENLAEIIPKIKSFVVDNALYTIIPEVKKALEKEKIIAETLSEQIFMLGDSNLSNYLLEEIWKRTVKETNKKAREIYKNILTESLYYLDTALEKIKAYSLLLTVLILDNNEEDFKDYLSSFEEFIEDQKDLDPIIKNLYFGDLDDLFKMQDQKKQDLWFQKVKPLINYN